MIQVREISDPTPTFVQNSSEWKRNLSIDEYVEMETDLNEFAPSRYWAVFEDDLMVASCRAWIRPAVLKEKIGIEACIGNVFTGTNFRGKGYANHLMKSVTEILVEECDLVTLWSDIGKDYYTRFGYKLSENQQLVTIQVNDPIQWPDQAIPITSTQVQEIGQLHTTLLKSKVGPSQIATSAETPIYEMWIRQSIIKSSAMGVSLPDVWGARYRDSWCMWSYGTFSKTLVILTMCGPDVKPLIAAAKHAAFKVGLDKIEVYPDSLIESCVLDLGGEIGPRTGSLSMYISKYELVYPGKYAWF